MAISSHRKSIALFITIGALLVAVAVTLNIGLIVWNWRTGVMLVLGAIFCGLIIAGVVLNTIFLVREIRRNEQHDQFINAVTHELKTPVSSIRLYLETLQTRAMDDKKRIEFYGVMLADTDRLIHTIDQVLRAGQAKMWRKHHNLDLLNLGELVQESVLLARMRHHLPDSAIQCECAGAWVRGDAGELQAAVTNLLDNAIKYSKSEVRVRVEVAPVDEKNVAVRVHDEGVGISPAELKRIFRRFYRVPGLISTRVKGTGLGLFIVLATAKRHRGRAYAESAGPGLGSTFTLRLPSAERPSAEQPTAEQPSAQQPRVQQPRVQQPSAKHPNAQHPTAQQPSAQQPRVQQPSAQHPNAQHLTAQQPSAQPSVKQPGVKQPSAQQPTAQQPSAQQPNAPHPSAQQPSAQQPSVKQPSAQRPSAGDV